jgi:3-phosphoinositide dependent protein kinase-1
MIAGRFAFNDRSDYLTWQKVKKVEYEFPSGFDDQAKDLVQKLLVSTNWIEFLDAKPNVPSFKVHDPLKRLGAGPRGSPNDPSVLKSHVFFSSTVWTSLWTDPAPPIEAGLVKKEHPLAQGQDRNWEDVGAAWDELVNNDSDGIDWSSDAEALQRNGHTSYSPNPPHTTDIGPKDEIRASAFPSMQDKVRARSLSNDPSRDASSSSSHESSSGNAADRLRDSMERLDIRSGRTSPDGPARDSIRSRGRDRAPTPLRNNEPDPDL